MPVFGTTILPLVNGKFHLIHVDIAWLVSMLTNVYYYIHFDFKIASPCGASVALGSSDAIRDSKQNLWTITSGGLVARNGTADPTTANVILLVYVNGALWQEVFLSFLVKLVYLF